MKGLNMKTKTFVTLLLGMGLAAGSIAFAQDNALMQIPAQVVSDGGVEAIREAQEAPAPVAKKNLSPLKELQSIARERKWRTGWDSDRNRFITIVSDTVDTDNPATDDKFFEKREAAARRAYLKGKARIIEFFRQEMSASDSLYTPGTDIRAKFEQEMREYEAKMVVEKDKLAKMLEQYNRAEAEQLRGTTISDRLEDLMVAVIKKLDETYNAGAKDEKLKAQLEEAKKNLEEQKAIFEKLQKEAETYKNSLVREQVSEVTTMASMPLYGATVLMQLEGYDQKYQVAMIVVWSAALERAARALVTGEKFELAPKPDATSLDDWLDKQDFSSMVGPRTFLDEKGVRHFLGICAAKCTDDMDSVEQDHAKGWTEDMAKSATMFSVMGDVESYKSAKLMVNTYRNAMTGEAQEKAMKSVEVKIRQELDKKSTSGMFGVYESNTEHAIANCDIYVSVQNLDLRSAQDAQKWEAVNYATKIQDERYQATQKGSNAVNTGAAREAKDRPEDILRGATQQGEVLKQELDKRNAEKNPAPAAGTGVQEQAPVNKPENKAEPTRGIFGGDADVSDDF